METPTQVKLDTKTFWNANPCGTSESWERSKEIRYCYADTYLVLYLSGSLLEGKSVLDVGCGQGHDASEITQRCKSYVGIDMSDASLRIARNEVMTRKPEEVLTGFAQCDAEGLAFADESFDTVYSIGVIHITPHFDEALNEIHRVLQSGGTLILLIYRSYTPLWLITRVVRAPFKIPVIGRRLQNRLLAHLRRQNRAKNSFVGTALLELIGCPLIGTYTLRSMRQRFRGRLKITHFSGYGVGLEQIIRVLPMRSRSWWPQSAMEKLDKALGKWCGFYLFIIAQKEQ